MIKAWHSFSVKKVFETLNSSPVGLTEQEAAKRLKKYGLNKLPEEEIFSKFRLFVGQLKSPLIYILLIAGLITFALEEYTDSIVIFGAVVLNTIIGYLQEGKAGQALEKLKKIIQLEAVVFRNKKEKRVLQSNLVIGDAVFLRAGNKAPADCRIIEANNLQINEAPLTGEWLPAEKKAGVLSKGTVLADRDNMAFMGTTIESGWGKGIVVSVGLKTEIGKVAQTIKQTQEKDTPYQKRLSRFSRTIGLIIVIISSAIFIEGMVTGGKFVEMFTTSIAIAVAAIPEGLPVAMTVILALGMQKILKRKGLVRKLASAETLGSTSVILTDKTGTLTEAKMEVAGLHTGQDLLNHSFESSNKLANHRHSHDLALKIALLCNESFIENFQEPMAKWVVRGRPTEKALFLAALQAGFSKEKLEKKQPIIDQMLFEPTHKYAVCLCRLNQNQNVLYLVGSPEKLLSMSGFVDNDGRQDKLLLPQFKKIKERIDLLTKDGLRVVAVAYRKTKDAEIDNQQEEEDKQMVFVGVFALHDPLRKNIKEVIGVCRQSGMRPIIVTGDHKLTARAIAQKIGFKIKDDNILEGRDLEKMSDLEFEKVLKKIQVYARVEPKQKLRIVKAWQKRGEVVAMTGDGINDAPALKQADIGVAPGSGTDVAKEVSDLVLFTDNFNIIVAAIEEGRVIIDNIRKVITYLLSDSFAEVILVGVSLLFGYPLPIIAAQILWVNLIEDGPMGIALAFEKKEKDVMTQRPKNYASFLLNKEMKVLIFIIGIVTDLLLLGLFFWLFANSNYELTHIRTVVFAALTIDSLFYIFSCKSLRQNIWHINPFRNKFLIAAWIFGVIMLLSAIYLPVLQTLLKTTALNLFDWFLVLGIGLVNIILIESTKYIFITRKN